MEDIKHIIFCVDLDGTMYDNTHRIHLIPADRTDTQAWAAFNCACMGDTVRPSIQALVESLIGSCQDVRFLTGRGSIAREPTIDKLYEDIQSTKESINRRLWMRDMGDYRAAPFFKREVIEHWLAESPTTEVVMLEDDPAIVEVMRNMERVTVLQIDSLCADVRTKHG